MSVVSVNCKECGSISVYCECVKRREATRKKWIEYAKESEASLLRNKGKHTIVKA